MIKSKVAALLIGAAVLASTASCQGQPLDKVSGEIVHKEYEPRNCEHKNAKRKCVSWDPAEYELTIRNTETSQEIELVVSKSVYDQAQDGQVGTWEGRID